MTLNAVATAVGIIALCSTVIAAEGSKASQTKTMSATGTVTSVSGGSLVIQGADKKSLTFTVDSTTHILVRGATAKTKERQAAGAAGLAITDVVRTDDRVTVRYHKTGDAMLASEVRVNGR